MRKIIFPLLASMAVASPALANEARVEARAGAYWLPGQTEATAGVAAGYDYDLGPAAFAGVEVSADKVLTSGTKVAYGFTGRLGANLVATKVFAAGGYTTETCGLCNDDAWHAGVGAEVPLMPKLYGKVEYRHFFVDNAKDRDALMAGVGIKF